MDFGYRLSDGLNWVSDCLWSLVVQALMWLLSRECASELCCLFERWSVSLQLDGIELVHGCWLLLGLVERLDLVSSNDGRSVAYRRQLGWSLHLDDPLGWFRAWCWIVSIVDCRWNLIYICRSFANAQIRRWNLWMILINLGYFGCFLDKLGMFRALEFGRKCIPDRELSRQFCWLWAQSSSWDPGVLCFEEAGLDLHGCLSALLYMIFTDLFGAKSIFKTHWSNGRCSMLWHRDAYRILVLLSLGWVIVSSWRVVGGECMVGRLSLEGWQLGGLQLVFLFPFIDCADKLRVTASSTSTSGSKCCLVRTKSWVFWFRQFRLCRFLEHCDLIGLWICNIAWLIDESLAALESWFKIHFICDNYFKREIKGGLIGMEFIKGNKMVGLFLKL